MSTAEQREAAAKFFLKDITNNVRDWIETGILLALDPIDVDILQLAELLAVREAALTRRADTITNTADELRQLQGIATLGGTVELEVPWRTDEARADVERMSHSIEPTDDETENAIIYALEAMRDSRVWRGPMRIDGSVKEFAEDVRTFVKAADDMNEGRNVVSLGTYQAAADEVTMLREHVATLTTAARVLREALAQGYALTLTARERALIDEMLKDGEG